MNAGAGGHPEGHDSSAYGRGVAGDYDELYADIPETEEAVARLAELAAGGAVLEFGIGTGRLAIPLAAGGLRVAGIEGSPEMAQRLAAKPGAGEIEVGVGDFATTSVAGPFRLVVLALNTIFALPDQDAQVACFENAARHLEPGGLFVVEAFVLDPEQQKPGHSMRPRFVSAERVELQLAEYDPARQRIDRVLVHLREQGTRIVNVQDRYAWPGELDLMARLAGMRLRERWGSWLREPFDVRSTRHVSVYQRGSSFRAPKPPAGSFSHSSSG